MQNELYYGDNLDVLRRKIPSASVDLCYIDPPFNSKRNYFQIYNNQGSEDRAQAQAFVDTWNWGDEAVEGIDYILKDRDENGKAIFQVKSRSGNRSDLATLNSDRQREKAEFGFLICTSLPTKPMRDEIAAAGKYKHPLLDREDDRLQVITVAELFQGKSLDLPMARADAVKSAAAKGDADKQVALDL
jgi:hypothetical protein